VDLKRVRNIGIAAHIDAGKTTVTERILYYAGRLHRMGNVDEGTAAMDWRPEEQQRGITIVSAATSCFWKNRRDRESARDKDRHLINIIDTPGHVDFTMEVERCMRVLDGVVVVFCGVGGVEAQSETVWRQADRYGVPRLCFVNKLDRMGSDMLRVVEDVSSRLGANALPVQLPLGKEADFSGVIDLIDRRAYVFRNETLGAQYDTVEVPDEYRQSVEQWRAKLIETLAEEVDWLTEKYLQDEPISPEELRRGLRRACIGGRIYPVLCGAALRNRGIQQLLDAVCDYLPSPLDIPPARGRDPESGTCVERQTSDEEPLSALAFKIQAEKHGDLYYLRVYSGRLKAHSRVYNANQGKMEHVARLYRMHANDRQEIEGAGPGSIVAALGLKDTVTGDTLCEKRSPVVYERMAVPQTVISMAIEPKTQADKKRLDEALSEMAREDPTFTARVDPQTGQLLINGMGELHLQIIKDRLLREFNVDANVGEPRVSYRESIARAVTVEEVFCQEAGGRGQFARVVIEFVPHSGAARIEFDNRAGPETIPHHFARAVERALTDFGTGGSLYGFPLINVKATLLDGETHPVDSTELAFEAAASRALRKALDEAGCELFEPVMSLEIVAPEQYLGDLINYLNSRRGAIHEVSSRNHLRIVRATAPLVELFGFATTLRSTTQGRGTYSMEPEEYRKASIDTLHFG